MESREPLFQWENLLVDQDHPNWDLAPDDQQILGLGTLVETAGRYILVQNFSDQLKLLVPN